MQKSISPFKQYLRLTKQWYNNQKAGHFAGLKNLNIVIGNESADLDSTAGSLIYAYYKFCSLEQNATRLLQEHQISEKTDYASIFVPFIQCNAEDIKIRFECVELLEKNQIDVSDLLFKEDIAFEEIKDTILRVHLYDHNCTTYPVLKNKVVDILDHHKDLTAQFYDSEQNITKNIQVIGSATSLLGEYFIDNQQIIDEVIADSIRTTVILDTYNFDPKQEGVRWNNRDLKVYEFMTQYLKENNSSGQVIEERSLLFKRLENLKFDTSKNLNLGAKRLLIKDYKQFSYSNSTQVGYSVFMISPEALFDFSEKASLENEFRQFIQSKSLDVLILLFAYPEKDVFQRKIIILTEAQSVDKLLKIQQKLQTNLKIAELDFKSSFNHFKDSHFSFFDTTHTYTRKIIEPLVSEIDFSSAASL